MPRGHTLGPLPLLLLLTSAQAAPVALLDVSSASVEDRFHTELRLLIGEVVLLDAPDDFRERSATQQLTSLEVVVPAGHTAVWLAPQDDEVLRASVAVVVANRAEVRTVEVPAVEGGPAHLALAVRAQLEARLADVPVPPPPSVPRRWHQVAAVSHTSVSGALRAGASATTRWSAGPLDRIGPRFMVEVGQDGLWLSPGVAARWSLWTFGADATVVHHPWASQLRPALWTGLQWTTPSGLSIGAEVSVLPLRDRVFEDSVLLYDSGRVELGTSLAWSIPTDG